MFRPAVLRLRHDRRLGVFAWRGFARAVPDVLGLADPILPHAPWLLIPPCEDAMFPFDRVIDHRNLPWQIEETLLDEHVAFGEKDAEARMRVIPADDLLGGV